MRIVGWKDCNPQFANPDEDGGREEQSAKANILDIPRTELRIYMRITQRDHLPAFTVTNLASSQR
jgi:hypothetical protein